MKKLFLLRHAKSSWSDPMLHDQDRPLNNRGKRQLGIMSDVLSKHEALDAHIFSSNAERAQQTITGIIAHSKNNNVSVETDKQLYTFNRKKLLKWLQSLPDDLERVLIVGHNPALEELLEYLLKVPSSRMPTCSFAHLHIDVNSWSSLSPLQSKLICLVTPATASYKEFSRKSKKNNQEGSKLKPLSLQEKLISLYQQSQALTPGCLAGKDPEFFHQYRDTLQKTRSIVDAIHLMANDNTLARHQLVLKQHQGAANEIRDLDEFIQNINIHKQIESDSVNKSKTALIKHIQLLIAQKQQEYEKHISSVTHSQDNHSWLNYLHSEAFRNLVDLIDTNEAKNKLKSLESKLSQQTANLGTESNDDDFHRARKLVWKCHGIASTLESSEEDHQQHLKKLYESFAKLEQLTIQIDILQDYLKESSDKKREFAEGILARFTSKKNELKSKFSMLR